MVSLQAVRKPIVSSATLDNTAAIIPALNAAAHIADVIANVGRHLPPSRIIVIDDGSSDGTGKIAADAGAVVVTHEVNRGKGAALKTGFDKAIEMGVEWVVTLDADGQHDPDEIELFLRRQNETGADIIVGNRMADIKDMPPIRIFANRTTSAFVSLRAGQKIPDSQNGYRLIATDAVRDIELETTRYDTESEILIKAARSGARIESVPVKTIYGEEVSKVNPFIDTLRFFRMVFKSLFW